MDLTLQPRAWPNSTIAEMTCAHKTAPFGELSELQMCISSIALNLFTVCFLGWFWQAAPRSLAHDNVAPLSLSRIVAMPIMLSLALGTNLLFWMLCDAIGCYYTRVDDYVGLGMLVAKCGGIGIWITSFVSWMIFMWILMKVRRERWRNTSNAIELQRQSFGNVWLPKPPKIWARKSRNHQEAMLPAYAESTYS